MAILLDILAAGVTDATGGPLSQGKVYVYQPGTTSKQNCYTDADLTVQSPNPLTLNDAGRAEIYVNDPVRLVIEDVDGVTVDDIESVGEVASLVGDVTIGTDSADTLRINSRIGTDLDPKVPAIFSLGDETNRWKELHSVDVDCDTASFDSMEAVDAEFTGIVTIGDGAHSISEDFANEVANKVTRPTGVSVGDRGVAISTGSGNFTTGSSSFVDVTNLSVEITILSRPVRLLLVPTDQSVYEPHIEANGAGPAYIRFLRDSTDITDDMAVDNGFRHQVSSFGAIDNPGPGTFTYKVQARTTSPNIAIVAATLVVYEL